ncbi:MULTISPECIES: DUF2946 family protein [Hydrocarboniphaga]|uniref:DUF2946 domain-containing protein n=1 Tax=Hydrocarboniphaga effusa AP103 TaxID=1172194 RepID=I8I6A4_9GAMM|nr:MULTISPECIES: DUF2946 family protein [Hydrocarboniphaga]EIT72226.1 hypothetical protein WQQ_23630 [Hydrocarboniphaga effusa AP103]MDZ4079640.1 DUF2946 family protein [Hydrocarboniphaga sp.]
MEDWVLRALAKWPDVPALFGWLSLDRRGRWYVRGEPISRPQIIDTIGRNYAADEQGRWYFQNGPQRGYVSCETAPLVLLAQPDGSLRTHNGLLVREPRLACLDEEGSLLIVTEHGPAALDASDLDWALSRLRGVNGAVTEDELQGALDQASGEPTALTLVLSVDADELTLPVKRLDLAAAPAELGYVRDPQPGAAG